MSAGGGDGERPIIIINKKGHGGHGHHGGSWKVAIADLMTAMMALFMVLWLVGQSPKTRAAVGAYFRDPLGLAGGGNTDVNVGPRPGGASFFEGGNTAISEDLMISPGSPRRDAKSLKQDQILDLQQRARDRLAQALMKLRHNDWARHVELTKVEDGLRIEIQDTEEGSLFPSGGTAIHPDFKEILATIAEELGSIPNHIVIEGHTDSTPFSGRSDSDSNWEVSTKRANAARRFMLQNGLREEQVEEIRGYADQRLRLWHDPQNPRNRRVSVLVLLEPPSNDKPADTPPPKQHNLDKRLKDLDYRARDPSDPIEIAPGGKRLPLLPSKE